MSRRFVIIKTQRFWTQHILKECCGYLKKLILRRFLKGSICTMQDLYEFNWLEISSWASLKVERMNKRKNKWARRPYSFVVGSLMYAMVRTRPNIDYVVGFVSKFLLNPGKEHWEVEKWILRYLRGTTNRCLCFGNGNLMLIGYSNIDIAGDVNSRKFTLRYLITFVGRAIY